ncbi:hypothetical protein ACTHOQ_02125 [Solibacillus silvestris]|uniref:hypothetical protein n=1 Tax=Solibacillus silvestris TaxID=76853 RepID=UPI003F801553
MEGLIIMIVMIIISSLFGKGKEQQKKESKQMPPFSSQPAPRKQEAKPKTETKRPKRLEDFANEVFGQLNEKAKTVIKEPEPHIPKQEERPVSEPVKPAAERRGDNSNRGSRSLTERPIVAMAKRDSEAFQVVPSNQRELMQAIIMTEVLGPPKANRK